MTTTYVLELRSTADWSDVRYRAYTTSAKKAENFKRKVPRIQFTDSGHGIIPVVSEHQGRREPTVSILSEHVRKSLTAPSPDLRDEEGG